MKELKDSIQQTTLTEMLLLIGSFLLILVSAKFGQYIYYHWQTSPAVLWPSTGIAIAMLWFGGYRYAIPVFLALLGAAITSPSGFIISTAILIPLGQILGIIACVYLLQRFEFEGDFASIKNLIIFVWVIVVTSAIAPTIATVASLLTESLSVSAYISWSRAWAGHTFSALTLTPLIITWMRSSERSISKSSVEATIVASLLISSIYVLFWQSGNSEFTFIFFTIFFLTHFWICFRFSSKIVALSIITTTGIGILGIFLVPHPERALNSRLVSTELFLFIVIPIFYAFSALVKERFNTVRELQNALVKIEEEGAVKNNFISVLAHELRNPLAPIKTTLEILQEQQLDAPTQELITSAHYQVHAMRRMLDDLLDVTRITQGKFQLQIERSFLSEMIERAVTLTKSVMDRGHTFVLDPTCKLNVWLNVDPLRIEQALVNILSNAAKYTKYGGTIEVSTKRESGNISIIVKDNGIGITPEHLPQVFDAFWQAKEAGTSHTGGIGVGLSLTKHIVELHGGTIRAASPGLNQGSTFTITLPYSEETLRQSDMTLPSIAPVPKSKILVVDDNHAAADSLAKLLTLKGHEARVAYSGTSTLDIAKEFGAEVILLDIGLPDITGYEVATKLRLGGFNNLIIALSGYGQREDREQSKEAGCDYHITKPMSINRLETCLRQFHGLGRL